MTSELPDANWDLSFGDYQEEARKTAIYPENAKVTYPLLGLTGEVGEFANKYKKVIRDGAEFTVEDAAAELGDILWYLSALATDLGIGLDYVANYNLEKLHSRQLRGTLGGSGDTR